jgi:hypothetical protein
MRDRWARDRQTNARGLIEGERIVRSGAVKIGGTLFRDQYYDRLKAWEGKKVVVKVTDCFATEYTARDPETWKEIARLK